VILTRIGETKARSLYSIKIKEQTRKLATVCSKHCFEVVDKLTKSAQNTVLRLQIELTKSVTSIRQGEADVV